jgi:hypothetical protein
MTEEEEFEFRLRLEQEQAQEAPVEEPAKMPRLATERLQGMATPEDLAQVPSEIESLASGVTALPKGAFQLGANIGDVLIGAEEGEGFGDVVNRELVKQALERKARREAVGREGFDFGELAGMVGSPLSMMKTGIAKGVGVGGKMAEGAKLGGLYGAAMPVTGEDFAKEKVSQIGAGAGLGATIPLVGAGVSHIGESTKPFTERFVREHVGESKDKIIDALQKARSGETSAQAIARANRAAKEAGRPESFGGQFVATEKALSKKQHGGDALKSVYEKQQADRENIINAIAGTDKAYKTAIGKRAGEASKNYKEAFSQAVKIDPELAQMSQNPYFKKALGTAMDLSKAKGINPKDNTVEFLHQIKLGIDKQLKKTGDDALSSAELKEAQKLKDKLVGWLGKKAPSYEKARAQYAESSVPIGEMDVGRELSKKLVSPTDAESIAPFMRAVQEAPKTIKTATGFKGQKLEDVLKPEQVSGIRKVSDELLNEVKRRKMAGESESLLPQLSGEVKFSLPHILSRPVVVTNALLSRIGRDKTPEYQRVLADIMKNPQKFEQILTKGGNGQKMIANDILDQITKASSMGAVKAVGE